MNRSRLVSSFVAAGFWVSTAAHPATSDVQSTIVDRFAAVTESEWSIELDLGADGRATYTHSSWEAGKHATATTNVVEARWEIEEGMLTITFGEPEFAKTVVYAATACLSYEAFGESGCSSGLSPVSNEMSRNYWQPLWSVSNFMNR